MRNYNEKIVNNSIKMVRLMDWRSPWGLRIIDIVKGMIWEDKSVVEEEWDV